jgi:hypothetical protein
VFATGSGAIQLRFFNDGSLFYTTYERGGEVRSIFSTAPAGGTTSPPSDTSPNDRKKKRACKKYKKHGKDRKAKKLGCKKSNDRDGRNQKKRR